MKQKRKQHTLGPAESNTRMRNDVVKLQQHGPEPAVHVHRIKIVSYRQHFLCLLFAPTVRVCKHRRKRRRGSAGILPAVSLTSPRSFRSPSFFLVRAQHCCAPCPHAHCVLNASSRLSRHDGFPPLRSSSAPLCALRASALSFSWSLPTPRHWVKILLMFTGIIEHFGTIESLMLTASGGRVTIHAPTLANSLAISNSIAVNGCCLTIVSLENDRFSADLSGETIRKTSFGAGAAAALRQGVRGNLEH